MGMRQRHKRDTTTKKKEGQKKEDGRERKEGKKEKEVEREGDCTSYLREECTRGHILHSTAVACPMFNSLSLALSLSLSFFHLSKIGNITQYTSGATDNTPACVIRQKI